MSSRKIKALLKRKGIVATRVEYERGCPTPSGYANGYSLEFNEETEIAVFDAKPVLGIIDMYMEFDTAEDVYKFIENLPTIETPNSKGVE